MIVALARPATSLVPPATRRALSLLEARYPCWELADTYVGLCPTYIGLALLPGPPCLATFRIRSVRGRKPEAAHGCKRLSDRSFILSALYRAPAGVDHWEGIVMGTWFWLNIPLALLFFCCWVGIPLWLTFTRWNTEYFSKHAEMAAKADPGSVFAQPAPAVAHEASSPAYAGAINPLGR